MEQDGVIRQAYRFALDPSVGQEALLASFTGASRFWFNQGLALVKERLDRRATGEEVTVPWSYKQLCSEFKGDAVKDELAPWRSQVPVGSYQAGLEALGKALQNFSQGRKAGRRVGFPRFRRKGKCRESVIFQRPRIKSAREIEFDGRLGPIRTRERMSKLIRLLARDQQARVMRATVGRSGSNWYVSFTVERSAKQRRSRQPDAAVGVDVGLTRLATTSDGRRFANARPLQGALQKVRRLQQQLDRQRRANNPINYLSDGRAKPGASHWVKSKRMLRVEARLRRLHERVANLRREQAHGLTTYLTREFGVIGVEALAVKHLMANRRLARHISDVGWGMILAQLRYKTSWSGGSMLVAAGRFFPSSKTCSDCGKARAKLALSERIFTCDACGLVIGRDLNAALNLAHVAQQRAQAEGRPECYVARTGQETQNARRGQVSPRTRAGLSPLKREDSSQDEPTRARKSPAVAAYLQRVETGGNCNEPGCRGPGPSPIAEAGSGEPTMCRKPASAASIG
jgi:putative transposase